VSSIGEVVGNDHTLVLSPDDWAGTKLAPTTTLNVVIQKGLLTAVPTFRSGPPEPRCRLAAHYQHSDLRVGGLPVLRLALPEHRNGRLLLERVCR